LTSPTREQIDTVASSAASADPELQLAKLRSILQDHVEQERFADAAEVQREIQALERGVVKGEDPTVSTSGRVAGRPERLSGGRAMLTDARGPMESYKGKSTIAKVKMVLTDDERKCRPFPPMPSTLALARCSSLPRPPPPPQTIFFLSSSSSSFFFCCCCCGGGGCVGDGRA